MILDSELLKQDAEVVIPWLQAKNMGLEAQVELLKLELAEARLVPQEKSKDAESIPAEESKDRPARPSCGQETHDKETGKRA